MFVRRLSIMMGTGSAMQTRKGAYAIPRSSCTAAKRVRLTTKRQATTNESQDHLRIENYFTESMWSMLRSSAEMRRKLASVANFVVGTLGLLYPNGSTIASIVGVIVGAHAQPMTYQEARDYRAEFAGYLKRCRSKRLSIPGLARYPQSIAEFLRAEPDRYAPGQHPVECPVTSAMIESGRHLVSACDTHGAGSMISRPTVSDKEVASIIGHGVQTYHRDGRKNIIYTHTRLPLKYNMKGKCDNKFKNAFTVIGEHKPKGRVLDW